MTNRKLFRLATLVPAFVFVSCAQTVARPGFDDVQTIVSERTNQRVTWNQSSEDDAKVEQAVSELLKDELTADEAVQIALLNNPDLQMMYETLGLAQADLVQAGLLSNPVFDAEVHFTGGGIGKGTNLNVFQEFINILQLPLRKRIAEAQFEKVKRNLVHSVLTVAGEVKSTFLSLQSAQEMVEFRKNILESLRASTEITRRMHAAGGANDLDLATDHALFARGKLELAQAEADVIQYREKTNQLLGLWGPQIQWKSAPKLPELPEREIPTAGLESLAVSQRQDLVAAKSSVQAAAEKLGLTESFRYLPELTIGVDFEGEDGGKVEPGPNFQFPIPLWDQGQARVASANSELRQAQKQYYATAVKIRSEVRAARDRMLAARARAEYAQSTLIPWTRQAMEQTQLEYNSMLIGVFQLLTAKKDEIDAGKTYLEALRDYWLSRVDLENAVGGSLQRKITTDPQNLAQEGN